MSILGRGALGLALVLAPAAVDAAGFNFGESGLKALSLGGAFAGQADDLTAVKYNPAGLTQLQGFHFLVDAMFLNHEVNFQRTYADGTPIGNPVSNSGGLFFEPNVGLGFGGALGGHPLTVALSVYPPPADGRYTYPTPDYTPGTGGNQFVSNPRKFAAQRYGLISSDTIILYPSLSAAFALHKRFSLGGTFQYVFSKLKFSEAAYTPTVSGTPSRTNPEDAQYDSIVNIDMNGKGGFTGILGALFKPVDALAIGLSFRPPVALQNSGTLKVDLGPFARAAGASVSGDKAEMSLTLPMEIKFGVHVTPTPRLGINADLVYEGWQSLQEIVISPQNVSITFGGKTSVLQDIHVPKHYHHTLSGRVGVEYAFEFGLSVRAGALYEQSAAPVEYTNIDFAHFDRLFLTAGLGMKLGPLEVLGTFAYVPSVTVTVTDSKVVQASTDALVPGGVVGDGSYSSGGWIVGGGLRGHFGG